MLRLIWRCYEIVGHLFLSGSLYITRRVLLSVGVGPSSAALRGDFVTGLLESLGPTFIKIGQILSTRADVLSPQLISALERLQDRVKPFSGRMVPTLIETSFGQNIRDIFDTLSLTPIASASIAQVHRGRLVDGKDVAVKVRRPGIVETVRNDFRLFRLFARMVERLPGLHDLPVGGMINEFGKAIEQQMDFRLEADNNRRFRQNFQGMKHVRIPRLIDELCTDSILTMEYLGSLRKLDDFHLSSEERKEAAMTGLHALYRMIFLDGFVHIDLHPANIFFAPGPQLVLLDFGLVAKLERADIRNFVRFFLGLVTNDGRECARVIIDGASHIPRGFRRDLFETRVADLVSEYSSVLADTFEVGRFVADIFEVQRRFRVRGPTNFTLVILSLFVYEGIVKKLFPGMDFQQEARRVLPWALLAASLP